jgi:hypothetical protein
MPRPPRKSPDELMLEAFWSLSDICRLFRKGPKTIMQYINHPDTEKRLPGLMINGEFCAEKTKVLAFFKYSPEDYPLGTSAMDSEFDLGIDLTEFSPSRSLRSIRRIPVADRPKPKDNSRVTPVDR